MTIKYLLRSLAPFIVTVCFAAIYPVVASAMDVVPMSPTLATLDIEHAVRQASPTDFVEIGRLKPVYLESYRTAGQNLADPPIFI